MSPEVLARPWTLYSTGKDRWLAPAGGATADAPVLGLDRRVEHDPAVLAALADPRFRELVAHMQSEADCLEHPSGLCLVEFDTPKAKVWMPQSLVDYLIEGMPPGAAPYWRVVTTIGADVGGT